MRHLHSVRLSMVDPSDSPSPHMISLSGALDAAAKELLDFSNHLVETMEREELFSLSSFMLGMRQQQLRIALEQYPTAQDELRKQICFLFRRCMRMLSDRPVEESESLLVAVAG